MMTKLGIILNYADWKLGVMFLVFGLKFSLANKFTTCKIVFGRDNNNNKCNLLSLFDMYTNCDR